MNLFQNCKLIGDQVDPDVYHRQEPGITRGNLKFVMTRSELMLFASNPARWIAGYQPNDSDATDWGSLIDIMVLDWDRFDKKVAVKPATYTNSKGIESKWTKQSNFCKDWESEREGMLLPTAKKYAEARTAVERLLKDERILHLIRASKKQVLVVGEYHDKATGIVVDVKTLIDLVPEVNGKYGKCLADLKTARNASPRPWNKAIFDRHYDAQAALCLDLYTTATKEDRVEFRHVIQENIYPWQTARRLMSAEHVQIGRMKISSALQLYCRCLKENKWPSWDDEGHTNIDGWTITQPEEWQMKASMESLFSVDGPEEETSESDSDDVPT